MGNLSKRSLSEAISIGNLRLPGTAVLAPMSGVSDLPFRRIAARYGAGMVVSEMIACESFMRGDAETQMRAEAQEEGLHVVQIAGREAHWMREAAKVIADAGADVIDINMGCPAKKVTSGYSGSALMRDLDHALRLIEATVNAVDVPVTLKMRLGWDEETINAPDLGCRAEAAGIQLLTVHGRTRNQFYKGQADWTAIRSVVDSVSIPVIANGDCCGFDDALAMLNASGAQAVMIGRGAYGRPWLAGHVSHFLQTGDRRHQPSGEELKNLVLEHYESMLSHYGVKPGVRIARKHLGWYLDASGAGKGISKQVRQDLMTSHDPLKVISMIEHAFSFSYERSAA